MNADMITAVSAALGSVLVPVALGLLGYWISHRNIHTATMDLAVSILAGNPAHTGKPVRAWAIKILEKYSKIRIDEDAREYLLTTQMPKP